MAALLMGAVMAALCWQHGVLVSRGCCGGAGQDGDGTGARVAGEDATGTAQRSRIHSRAGMGGGAGCRCRQRPASAKLRRSRWPPHQLRERGGAAVGGSWLWEVRQSIISRGATAGSWSREGEARRGESAGSNGHLGNPSIAGARHAPETLGH